MDPLTIFQRNVISSDDKRVTLALGLCHTCTKVCTCIVICYRYVFCFSMYLSCFLLHCGTLIESSAARFSAMINIHESSKSDNNTSSHSTGRAFAIARKSVQDWRELAQLLLARIGVCSSNTYGYPCLRGTINRSLQQYF